MNEFLSSTNSLKYTSTDVHNQFIDIMYDNFIYLIKSELENIIVVSIIMDKVTDNSLIFQLTIILKY